MQLACQPFSWAHAVQWQWVDVCYWHHPTGTIVVHRIHWDTATRREWEQEILPRAALFYSRQLAPALQQVLVNLTSSGVFDTHLCAATPGSQSQLADQLSSIPHHDVAPSQSSLPNDVQVPSLQAGLQVRDAQHFNKGIGTLEKEKTPGKWVIAWPEAQARKRPMKAGNLQPVLISHPTEPNGVGQIVLCHSGTRYAKHGRIVDRVGKEWILQFKSSDQRVHLPSHLLHAIPTPASDVKALPAAPRPLLQNHRVPMHSVREFVEQHQHARESPCELLLTRPSSNQQLAILLGEVKFTAATAAFGQRSKKVAAAANVQLLTPSKQKENRPPGQAAAQVSQFSFSSALLFAAAAMSHTASRVDASSIASADGTPVDDVGGRNCS